MKYIFNTLKIFRENSVFQGKSKLLKSCEIFNIVYIHLWATRGIWASAVCNLDQSRDRL